MDADNEVFVMNHKQNKIKVAFLGGGVNSAAGYAHFSAINIDSNYELVAGVFSTKKEVNYQSAEVYKVDENRVYNSIDELIENERSKIDAIIILTPSNLHRQHVISVLNQDIPVICEKSISTSVKQAEQIKEILEQRKCFLSVMYNYLGYPIIRELKRLIKEGKLGKVIHIQIEMPQEGFIMKDKQNNPIIPQKWRLQDSCVATISLDLGVHLHMFIKYLTNETPVSVISRSESLGNFSSVIDNVNSIIEYSNNVICNMWYSKIATGNRNGLKLRIYGETGSAEWVQETPELLFLADIRGNRWKIDRGYNVDISNQKRYTRFKVGHPAGFIEAFANYYYDIAIALNEYKNNRTYKSEECFGIAESIEGLKLFEAINRSNISRKWEKV